MISGAEVRSLGYTAVGSNSNCGEIIDPDVLAEPSILADLQIPRELYANAWLNINTGADLRAEQP
jgi:hypothetical protein